MKTENDIRRMEEELVNRMQEEYRQWYEEHKSELVPPPLDLSFMDGEDEQKDSNRTEQTFLSKRGQVRNTNNGQRHFSRRIPLLNAAAMLCLFVILSGAMAVWLNSDAAHALKFRMEKVFMENGNNHYSTDGESPDDNDSISVKITDPDEMNSIRKLVPELLLPKELPEGYVFASAEAESFKNDVRYARLQYTKNKESQPLFIEEYYLKDPSKASIPLDAEEINMNGKKAYYVKDFVSAETGLIFIEDRLLVQINGAIREEEYLGIMNTLVQ